MKPKDLMVSGNISKLEKNKLMITDAFCIKANEMEKNRTLLHKIPLDPGTKQSLGGPHFGCGGH